MSRQLKFCGCKSCRAGRHRKGGKSIVKRAARHLRRSAKAAVAKGQEPTTKTSVSYTD
jgi:phage gpG-like protein